MMHLDQILILLAAVTALAGAVRSTWSPCGLSMLSSITPFGERSRGHRYGVTATWFILGATAGGATLGIAALALAAGASEAGIASHPVPVALVAAAVAMVGAAVDAGLFGGILPVLRRQVNDRWLSRYRAWVYAGGFGWQIGTGVSTYVMTSAVFVFVGLAILSADPIAAFCLATAFGAVRGLGVLLTHRASGPSALLVLHRRLERSSEPVRWVAIAAQAVVAVAAAAYIGAPAALVCAAVAIAGLLIARGSLVAGIAGK